MAFGKDWSVIALTFERSDLFRVNGNRGKGSDAVKMRDNAKRHARSVYWAVFDQKGRFIEGDFGPGRALITIPQLERFAGEVRENESVLSVLEVLRKGTSDKAAKRWHWAEETSPTANASTSSYTLVATDEGEEFESRLELSDEEGRLSGMLTLADGAQTQIENAKLEGRRLSFEVTFGEGNDAVRLSFEGKVAKDVVKGTFVT